MYRHAFVFVLLIVLSAPAIAQPVSPSPASVYSGGDGSSCDTAVIINIADWKTGVAAEYQWLKDRFQGGRRGHQSVAKAPGGRTFDRVEWIRPDGSSVWVCFDITEFFGKL
jgi:hypothetical protein